MIIVAFPDFFANRLRLSNSSSLRGRHWEVPQMGTCMGQWRLPFTTVHLAGGQLFFCLAIYFTGTSFFWAKVPTLHRLVRLLNLPFGQQITSLVPRLPPVGIVL